MKYFISFKWMDKDRETYSAEGCGHSIIELDSPVTSYESLDEITNKIKLQNTRIDKVVILNWQRMELPE